MTHRYVTVKERAEREHRSGNAIHIERHRGEGPPGAIVLGRQVLWPEDAYENWLASRPASLPRRRRRGGE